MDRKRIILPATATLALTAGGCSAPAPDITGTWETEISEPALFLAGTERLQFRADSTFVSISDVRFAQSDSAFSTTLGVLVSIRGRWSHTEDNTVAMAYDPSSLKVDTIEGSFSLQAIRTDAATIPDTVRNLMRDMLHEQISGYYEGAYANYGASEYVTMTEVEVRGNPPTLSATIGPVRLSWTGVASD